MAFKVWPPKASQVWVLVCNLGTSSRPPTTVDITPLTPNRGSVIFALTICVLASCRSTSESAYSLIKTDQVFFQKFLGDECYNASKPFVPNEYRIGLSGSCRIKDDVTACKSHYPRINWVTLFEEDVTAANATVDQRAILDQCVGTLHEKGVNHGLTNRLAAAMFALLIISVFLNAGALAAAAWCGSGFGKSVFIIELVDEMILVTCIGIFIGIGNHEIGGYYPDTLRLRDIDDKAILGVGFWLLIAMFTTRAISHPFLFIITLIVALLILILPLIILWFCCSSEDSRDETVVTVRSRVEHIWVEESEK
ncbi:hypothetical protein jhhlp_005308 [Lomentospora prolificans]|uniref:Uncharacterized protein n=1 Tax=Lomentospora prolificans TaxID=41688 RepID=A0A2N3N7H2_9PEZI|nr:hypothetical protein jhhlp_005308 [Lomentospora prolificans]